MLPTWFSRKSATEATKGTGFRVLASFKSKANPFPFLISLNEAHRWQEDDVWKGHILSLFLNFNVFAWRILHNKYNKCRYFKEVKVKPQPAKTVVKAFCVSALKKSI